jgi:hypothetical protein
MSVTQLELRKTIALEKIARCLAVIESILFSVCDGNDGTIRMKDVERAKVYIQHLGKKLRKK